MIAFLKKNLVLINVSVSSVVLQTHGWAVWAISSVLSGYYAALDMIELGIQSR